MAGRWKEDEVHSAAFYVGGHAEVGSVLRDEIVIKISFSLSNLLFFKSFLLQPPRIPTATYGHVYLVREI